MKLSFARFAVAAVILITAGCSPLGVVAGAGASVGLAASQEGGFRGAITDSAVQLKIADLWIHHSFEMYRKLSMTVKEGRVLITGTVPNADMRVDAVRLAWQADGVRQVLNEIAVDDGKNSAIKAAVKDGMIAANLKTKLLLDKYIQSINYNIDTANGNVYLMGIAQDQKELDRVIGYARNISDVRNVVSYVRLRYENPSAISSTAD